MTERLTEDTSKIKKIETTKQFEKYRKILSEITKICNPEEKDYELSFEKRVDIYWTIRPLNSKTIIGYLKLEDLKKYEKDVNFEKKVGFDI